MGVFDPVVFDAGVFDSIDGAKPFDGHVFDANVFDADATQRDLPFDGCTFDADAFDAVACVIPPVVAGLRSLLAPWLGGAAAPEFTTTRAGFRSLLAFWAGGSFAGQLPTQPPTDGIHVGSRGAPRRIFLPPSIGDEDEEILLLIFAALQVLDIN